MAEADAVVTYSEMSSVAFWIYGMVVPRSSISPGRQTSSSLARSPQLW